MIGLTILVMALALAPAVKQQVDSARNETTLEGSNGMNCSSSLISDYDKSACVVSDLSIFHYIGGLIFIAGAIVTARIIF